MTPRVIAFLSYITKRDGALKPFDPNKILSALLRAGQATGEYGSEEAEALTLQVVKQRVHLQGSAAPHIEQIRDVVESVLFDAGYRKTLRAYVVYREQNKKLHNGRKRVADVEYSINEYQHQLDRQVNSNHGSLGGLVRSVYDSGMLPNPLLRPQAA